ncbi:MAG: CDP-glucose 4,6-dehydratase [Candidatus Anoxychlamydiales bacterium]|nr:CDP-glucose 4,6-dehydratase [Candidatus Anoxychlamydiales bacterium]
MKSLFNNIYNKKKVFITGHTGFKGSWLLLWLAKLNAEITGYSLPPNTNPNHIDLLKINYNSIYGDICDFSKLESSIIRNKPEIIFHLAAQPLVLNSYLNPMNTIQTNIIGTTNILEICRKLPFIKALVIITSDKCYLNKNDITKVYNENDKLGGKDPYSASKACVEILSKSYQSSFFSLKDYKIKHNLLIATARAGNVIGGGDWSLNRIIPDIVKKAVNREKVEIRNPYSIRPWQFVLESLSGYLTLGQKLLEEKSLYAQSWNFGPSLNDSFNVLQMLEKFQKYWGKIDYKFLNVSSQKLEADFLKLDSSKANKFLSWKPIYNLEQTLLNTSDWYKEYYIKKTPISIKQLNNYIDFAKKQNLSWALE